MDSLIAAAGRALMAGDPLSALNRVALRNDPPALALRGIAMAQLGELARSRELLSSARRRFGPEEVLARARCTVAEAEVALALRDLGGSLRPLETAAAALADRGDHGNALHARLIAVRRLLLLGRLDAAASALQTLDVRRLVSPALQTVAELAHAEIALRTLRTGSAEAALSRARAAAGQAGVPALQAEVDEAVGALHRPAARWVRAGIEQPLRLAEVEALLATGALVVDGCRRGLQAGDAWQSLARRPVLFTLACALAEQWPGGVPREVLIARAFRIRRPDETHRVRLRVQMGRLRALLAPVARIEARDRGFALVTPGDRPVVVLRPPVDGEAASLQALLADGAPWSTSSLALALGESQRSIQRALASLQATARARSIGQGRAQRWLSAPMVGFTTILLLPASVPIA
ncbi:helix-turn-helix domain-containing protein [Roseateles amylovorans]|uniref:Helix-turn-helix domain-containing protein n=1 Tax=Roseateles amylovorans TaxID=2978473 RepID=A0ABY6BCB7_9BURK|nr:helix-turn-helix domain-containing protein [Roseateles amylovorans]UXH80844.1 helix-turn-helix domain-containing protein [Roseateles amylovorans]